MKKVLFAIFILMFVCILAFFSCSGSRTQENEDDSSIENETQEMSQQTVDNASGNVDRQNCQHTFSKWETKKGATCKK